MKFLDEWCTRTMRSKIEPMKKIAASLHEHRDLILNWFRAKGTVSAGFVEGLNNKAKLTIRKAFGFGPTKPSKSPYTTHLAIFLNQTSPTNSVEEAVLLKGGFMGGPGMPSAGHITAPDAGQDEFR